MGLPVLGNFAWRHRDGQVVLMEIPGISMDNIHFEG